MNPQRQLDGMAVLGTALGLGAVILGQWLEGGTLGQITQGVAALIVFGGTAGAVLLSFPWNEVRRALGAVPELYFRETVNLMPIIDEIVRIASLARKEGILALELQKSTIRHEPFRRAIQFVIDGFEPETVREILETEIDARREHEESRARVFEVAGAYAPTIGVLGAVLGLIHVLSMLSDPSKIGSGIAVAFVATVYGVGASNLFFLPWSSRLRRRAQERSQSGELVLIGILGIQEGLSPNFLGEKLRLYVQASDQDRRSEQGAFEAQRSSGGEAVS